MYLRLHKGGLGHYMGLSRGEACYIRLLKDDKVDHPGPGGPGLLNWTHRVVFNPTSDRMTLVVTPSGSWCLIMKCYIWAHHGAFLEEMGASGDSWYGWTGAASRIARWKGRPGGHIGQYQHPIPSSSPIIHTTKDPEPRYKRKLKMNKEGSVEERDQSRDHKKIEISKRLRIPIQHHYHSETKDPRFDPPLSSIMFLAFVVFSLFTVSYSPPWFST
jgi:hypothetical protein